MDRIRYKDMELLPVRQGLVFKAFFVGGSDLGLLASLLLSILALNIKEEDIVVTNTELPAIHETGEPSRLDIKIKTADGKNIDVEIQHGCCLLKRMMRRLTRP